MDEGRDFLAEGGAGVRRERSQTYVTPRRYDRNDLIINTLRAWRRGVTQIFEQAKIQVRP